MGRKIITAFFMPIIKIITVIFLAFLVIIIFSQDKEVKKDKIAILKMEAINVDPKTADTITETLTSAMASNNKYDVVERSQINRIFDELKLTSSDDFEKSDLEEIGRLTQAKLVLIGSVSKLENKYIINVRVLNVATGEAVYGDNISCGSTDELYDSAIRIADRISGKTEEAVPRSSSSSSASAVSNNFEIPAYIFTDGFDSFNTDLWPRVSKNDDISLECKNGTLQFSGKYNPNRLNSINSVTSREFRVSSFAMEISFRDDLASSESLVFSIGNSNWYYGNTLMMKVNFEKEVYGFYWSRGDQWFTNRDNHIYGLSGDESKKFHRLKIVYDLDTKTAYGYLDDKLLDKTTGFNFNREDKLEATISVSESTSDSKKDFKFEVDDFKSSIDLKDDGL